MGNHEIVFAENDEPVTGITEIPEELPEDADTVFAAFYDYYKIRASHPRAVNFVIRRRKERCIIPNLKLFCG